MSWPADEALQQVKRFRGGLVFKAHRLLYHSTLGLRVIKKKKKHCSRLRASLWGLIDSGLVWEGYRESRRCSRDTYPESYITKYTSIRRLRLRSGGSGSHPKQRLRLGWGLGLRERRERGLICGGCGGVVLGLLAPVVRWHDSTVLTDLRTERNSSDAQRKSQRAPGGSHHASMKLPVYEVLQVMSLMMLGVGRP